MSKLARVTQKIFGSTAGFEQIAQFGSLYAGTPTFTTNIASIQSLSNYLVGWFNAAIGDNSPAIEDMNALFYLLTTQIAYQFQAGIPEWDSGTTYYTGSMVNTPLYIFVITSGNATAGATYTNNSNTFTVMQTTTAYTIVICTSTGNPTASGTLTKSTGSGDATLTFSSYTVMAGRFVSLQDNNLNQALTVTAYWGLVGTYLGSPYTSLSVNSTGNANEYSYYRRAPFIPPDTTLTTPANYGTTWAGPLSLGTGYVWTVPTNSALTVLGDLTLGGTGSITVIGDLYVL